MTGDAFRGRTLATRPPRVEASLWRRLRFEGEARCREALFRLHHSFAKRIAGGEYRNKHALGLDRGDFEELSFGALLEAIDRFDPLTRAPFEAFARARIKGAIADGLAQATEVGAQARFRKRIATARLRSLRDDPDQAPRDPVTELAELAALLALGFIAENAAAGAARVADPFESTGWRDLELSVIQEIERLPHAERTIIQHHYCSGVDFIHIATLMGLSKGRISQLHRSALQRLREKLRRFE